MAAEVGAIFQDSCNAVVAESALPFVEENSFVGVAAAKKACKSEALLDKLRKYHGDKVNWVLSAWTDAWHLPEFADWNLFDALRNTRRPLLAIHRENDEYGSPRFPEIVRRLSGGPTEILTIPGCGHARRIGSCRELFSIDQRPGKDRCQIIDIVSNRPNRGFASSPSTSSKPLLSTRSRA